jgi:hypothetical protein
MIAHGRAPILVPEHGIGDSTAIWFAQFAGSEIHVIDFYEASGYGLEHYIGVVGLS